MTANLELGFSNKNLNGGVFYDEPWEPDTLEVHPETNLGGLNSESVDLYVNNLAKLFGGQEEGKRALIFWTTFTESDDPATAFEWLNRFIVSGSEGLSLDTTIMLALQLRYGLRPVEQHGKHVKHETVVGNEVIVNTVDPSQPEEQAETLMTDEPACQGKAIELTVDLSQASSQQLPEINEWIRIQRADADDYRAKPLPPKDDSAGNTNEVNPVDVTGLLAPVETLNPEEQNDIRNRIVSVVERIGNKSLGEKFLRLVGHGEVLSDEDALARIVEFVPNSEDIAKIPETEEQVFVSAPPGMKPILLKVGVSKSSAHVPVRYLFPSGSQVRDEL